MKPIQVSIVIVNYNVKALLLDCIQSIYAHFSTTDELEIIVVDNDSKDDSCAAVRENFPAVVLVENKFNAGFSGANNQGMDLAKGKYIFLLNPDTEIVGDALQQLISYMGLHPECAVLAPQLLNSDGSIQTSAWHNHQPADLIAETFFVHKFYQRLNYPPEQLTHSFEAKTLSGAALFFNRSLIEKMGQLDPLLFWMEDIDFCKRAQAYGSIYYLHTAKVYHHSGQSQRKNYNVAIANQLLSKLKYYRKHHTLAGFIAATCCCLIFILSRLLAFILVSPAKPIYRLKAQAYAYTFKRYLKYVFLGDKKLV